MFLLKIKKYWIYIKKYWQIPTLLIYTLVIFLFFRKDISKYKDLLEQARTSGKEEIDILEKQILEEKKKKEEIDKRYQDIILQIEKKYAEDKKELAVKEKKEIQKYVQEFKEDPNKIRQYLEEKYGLKEL